MELIIDQIEKYVSHEKKIVKYEKSNYIHLEILTDTKIITMNILGDEKWEDIKSSIDTHLISVIS